MGDFNTCLLKDDTRSKRLLSAVQSCNMHILPLSATHNFPNSTPSLLDLIIVSSSDHVYKFGLCSADAFSYHDLIFLSYKIRPIKAKSKILLQRNFVGMDGERLCDDARQIDWSLVADATSTDEKVNIFNSLLIQLYDVHAPVRPVKMKHLPAPWLTDDLKSLIAKKAYYKSRYKSNPSEENRKKYYKVRNRCNTSCRDAQRRHIHKSVENGDTAKTWKFLKTLGVGKAFHKSSSDNIDIERLNKHFSAANVMDSADKKSTLEALSSCPTPDYPPFTFSQFSECDVRESILSITSNAVGIDSIGRSMIVPIIDIVIPILTHILNYSITNCEFPEAWKAAQITPIPKKANTSNITDFRPISILPFLSKVLEKLVHQQLSRFLYKFNILNPLQSGFRPGHSTVTALVKVTDDIRMGMDNKHLTVLTLLDFSNAFNTVDFDILLGLLRSLNISPSVIDWFQSYLTGRRQRIRIEEAVSSWSDVNAGVPQGGVLSPLLFSLFINSITSNITSLYHMYADDIQIYFQSTLESLPTAVSVINNDLNVICNWSKKHGLKVNPSKSQAIIVGSQSMISRVNWTELPKVKFKDTVIPYSTVVKNLGIYLDCTLSWNSHIKELSRKTIASLKSLQRLRYFLPIPTKIMLAQALILSILDYADASYLNLTEEQTNKLERLQNIAIRFIFGLRKYDHVSAFRSKLKWLPIRFRRNLHVLSLLYCVLFHAKTPTYLKEKIEFLGTHNKVLRSAENLTLRVPVHNTKFYKTSFAVQAVQLWNALPLKIRQAQTLTSFKNLVKEHYLAMVN
ncbi:unnamed protein product [Euphydryas editha]|nr:unnamed protein product [Euphydryas editha]